MRFLSWDEVNALDKFLVEDNEEAIGLEIHSGIYDSSEENGEIIGFSRPKTVEKFLLSELAGGELIKFGQYTLCAVVCDRLYYKDSRKYVYNQKLACLSVGKFFGENYEYERAVLTFNRELKSLPKEEVFALDKFIVRDNKKVGGVLIEWGYMGIGGSNTSGFSAETSHRYTEEILNEKPIIRVGKYELCALVGDVLHMRYKKENGEMRMITLNYRERPFVSRGGGVAYDTISAIQIMLFYK